MSTIKLSFYPVDILSAIVEYLDAYSLAALWKCGDTRLNFILTEKVRRFELVYRQKERSPWNWVWPRLISHFPSLEILLVSSPSPSCICVVSSVDLSLIPKNIRRLELRFANAFYSFISLRKFSIAGKGFSETALTPTLERFPRLERWVAANHLSWKHNEFAGLNFLPRGLQTLYLQPIFPLSTSQVLQLPATLTDLQSTLAADVNEPVCFPSSLRSYSDVNAKDYLLIVRSMPSTLTWLHVPYAKVLNEDDGPILIPRYLRSLTMDYLPSVAFVTRLPSCLTALSASGPPQPVIFDQLPRALTNLSHVNILDDASLASSLPPLKSVNWSSKHPFVSGSGLFETLETLHFRLNTSSSTNASFVAWLPSLTNLSVFGAHITSDFVDSLSVLTKLTSLTLGTVWPSESFKKLRLPNLSTLAMSSTHEFEDLDMSPGNGWADRLVKLELNLKKHETDPRPIASVSSLHAWFDHLPHTLLTFKLNSRPSSLPFSLLRHLPPRLESLTLSPLSQFDPTHFQPPITWPQGLTHLHLDGSPWFSVLSEELHKYLPRTLYSLTIPSIQPNTYTEFTRSPKPDLCNQFPVLRDIRAPMQMPINSKHDNRFPPQTGYNASTAHYYDSSLISKPTLLPDLPE